jgi:hypothetical protein
MANVTKTGILKHLSQEYGGLRKLPGSESLYEVGNVGARVYMRYSQVHGGKKTFYGLRKQDLKSLEGHQSFICFTWNDQEEPLFVPFADYEEIFQTLPTASDGQYKVQIYLGKDATELYIARGGRFNVDSHMGWTALSSLLHSTEHGVTPTMSHSQVQTLLGAIGATKGFDIWVPASDRDRLDWSMAPRFQFRKFLPPDYGKILSILEEVDVVWMQRGANALTALYEVEHSTPVYSGLLRFNDIHLVAPSLNTRFAVVANQERRELFVRQLARPTFTLSGLSDKCSFLDYHNIYGWYNRVAQVGAQETRNEGKDQEGALDCGQG